MRDKVTEYHFHFAIVMFCFMCYRRQDRETRLKNTITTLSSFDIEYLPNRHL
jgi:hypothetical protein